ncbi:MAG: ribbon-helix-helix domain-containing protein [Pseudomonadota bacterium]
MRNHSITIRGHATSVSMEDEYWASLKMMAKARDMSVASLIAQIDSERADGQNLSSQLRLAVLAWWQQRYNALQAATAAQDGLEGSEPGGA